MTIKMNAVLFCLTMSLYACAQVNTEKVQTNKSLDMTDQKLFAQTFVFNFEDYKMDIEAAGMASIPKATLTSNKILAIAYMYVSGNEKRKGNMSLSYDEMNSRYEGNWETMADNGNVYSGSLFFEFSESGEANGHYKFSGSDYDIRILKKNE